jgi:putative exosortase-associated protein (TIGR04073 family)
MKSLICSLTVLASFGAAQADIQDPPAAKYDNHRKFGRGIANVAFGVAELPHTIALVNEEEGNSAALSVGVLSGVRRSLERMGVGVYEIATHPFARNRGTYKPYFKSPTRANHGTYKEFPPELGFESNHNYTRY